MAAQASLLRHQCTPYRLVEPFQIWNQHLIGRALWAPRHKGLQLHVRQSDWLIERHQLATHSHRATALLACHRRVFLHAVTTLNIRSDRKDTTNVIRWVRTLYRQVLLISSENSTI